MFLPCFARDLHALGASQGLVWVGFRQDSGKIQEGNGFLLRELCARNDFETTTNPSRIEDNTDKREAFKVWEVGRTLLVCSQGCTAEAPLYASMHSGGAAICIRPSLQLAFVGLDRAYSCLTCKHIKHSYVAHMSLMQHCVRECRTVATEKVQ